MSRIVITGGSTPGGSTPNRLEINTLIQDKVQFSLYVQALTVMFGTSQSNPISHFGIAGIHGLPYVQWDGAGGTRPVKGTQWDGYCTHGSMLFPTWHRPYVALYEQTLQQHALTIAQKYSDRQTWVASAQNLRAPFWDWATNSVPPPEVVSLTTISILVAPGGTPADVDNPLYQYTFNPISPSFPSPYDSWQTTIRSPDNPDSPDATTDVNYLISSLQQAQDDLTTSTYNLCSRVSTWPAFSNHTAGDGGSASNSLEGIHDRVHGTIGGQMGDPSVAGFDPIFFLHHCNVDRILSLWAAINPGVWVTRGPAEGGTWTIPGNATVDANTPLAPFWNSQSGFWASSGTTATSSLGYSYPEFNGLDLTNQSAVQSAISQYVANQYGGGAGLGGGSALRLPPLSGPQGGAVFPGGEDPAVSLFAQPGPQGGAVAQAPAAAAATHPFHSRGGPPHTAPTAGRGNEGQNVINDWACRVHCKKYELSGSYWVLVFIGDVPEDPQKWRTSPNYVGGHYNFVNSSAEQCSNCREQGDVVTEGFIHLNKAIASRSGLSSYEPDVVSPYLKDKLHWRVQTANRKAVDVSKLPSLEVTVSATPLTYSTGNTFPSAGEPYYHHHITYGRAGGARQAPA